VEARVDLVHCASRQGDGQNLAQSPQSLSPGEFLCNLCGRRSVSPANTMYSTSGRYLLQKTKGTISETSPYMLAAVHGRK
jgi:hypothetical protein